MNPPDFDRAGASANSKTMRETGGEDDSRMR